MVYVLSTNFPNCSSVNTAALICPSLPVQLAHQTSLPHLQSPVWSACLDAKKKTNKVATIQTCETFSVTIPTGVYTCFTTAPNNSSTAGFTKSQTEGPKIIGKHSYRLGIRVFVHSNFNTHLMIRKKRPTCSKCSLQLESLSQESPKSREITTPQGELCLAPLSECILLSKRVFKAPVWFSLWGMIRSSSRKATPTTVSSASTIPLCRCPQWYQICTWPVNRVL